MHCSGCSFGWFCSIPLIYKLKKKLTPACATCFVKKILSCKKLNISNGYINFTPGETGGIIVALRS
jgi:hypothetical protein